MDSAAQMNARFAELAAHYVFEPVFATPASGWEKGLVEGLVGYARRTFLVPVPSTPDWASLNALLMQRCQEERARILPRRGQATVGILWDDEQTAGKSLPAGSFRPATRWSVKVSKQALVRHRGVAYSVPTAYVGQSVSLYAFWDHVELWDTTRLLATHPLGTAGGPPQLQLDHYLDGLRHKPGAVRNARVVRDLGPQLRQYQAAFFRTHPEAYATFVEILFLFRRFPAEQILAALPAAEDARCFDLADLAERLATAPIPQPIEGPPRGDRPGPRIHQPDPSVYGQLVEGGRGL